MRQLTTLLLLFLFLPTYGQDSTDRFLGLRYADISKLENVSYVLSPKVTQGVLKPFIDLANDFPPVNSQGDIGSCASWASVYGVRSYLQKKQENYIYTINNSLDESKVFSPLFVYNQVKLRDTKCDNAGSYIKDNLELMKNMGVCKKSTFDPKPYTYPNCDVNPLSNANATNEARNFKINSYGWFARYGESYRSGYKLLKIKEFLNKGYPVIFGADIDYTFWKAGGDRVGSLKIWNRFDGTPVGAHAMVCIGYNDTLKAIKVFNSWGVGWGNTGYGWISYSMVDDYIFECYVLNVDQLVTTNTNNIVKTPSSSQGNKEKQNFAAQDSDTSFFVINRYQPYDNIRIMPVQINEREQSAIIKIYEVEDSKSTEIDVFSIKAGETYTFSINNKNYAFYFREIKPWKFWGQNAVFYTLKWTN
jgi:C1A family cysteine protease